MRPYNESVYKDKVLACWIGKNIGGTLGVPFEGEQRLLQLNYYHEVKEFPLANDDLDLQLVWLHALEQYGPALTAKELAQEWLDHVFFPFDEYGYSLTNLRLGLVPPLSGSFRNPFKDCMGAPIRSEIWACICPNNPKLAAYYAFQDAIVDHAGGEGVYGEMFFAAMQSAAFQISDQQQLIEIGLSCIPHNSKVHNVVCQVVKDFQNDVPWLECRDHVLANFGNINFTDAPQNIGFTLLGWLYAEDFGDAICKAVNCGYDTDCTGATLGALLGILGGMDSIPRKWSEPIGSSIVVSKEINGFNAPKDVHELTERVINISTIVNAWYNIYPKDLDMQKLWEQNQNPNVIVYKLPNNSQRQEMLEVSIDYGKSGPSIQNGKTRSIKITLTNCSDQIWNGIIKLCTAEGWVTSEEHLVVLKPGEIKTNVILFSSSNTWAPSYKAKLSIERLHGDNVWSKKEVELCLIPTRQWTIIGDHQKEPKIVHSADHMIPLNLEDFAGAKKVRAQTKIDNPMGREVRLMLASNGRIRAELDGRILLKGEKADSYIPAYHRADPRNYCEFTLSQGSHELLVELDEFENGVEMQCSLAIVSTSDLYYASFVDVRIG